MYTNRFNISEYPYYATFYHLGVDESKPLDERVEEKIVSFRSECDLDSDGNGINNDTMTLFFPFNPMGEDIKILLGETVELETYGIIQKGRVLGIRPSQLGGVKVLCIKI